MEENLELTEAEAKANRLAFKQRLIDEGKIPSESEQQTKKIRDEHGNIYKNPWEF
jgi:hypothetical protein